MRGRRCCGGTVTWSSGTFAKELRHSAHEAGSSCATPSTCSHTHSYKPRPVCCVKRRSRQHSAPSTRPNPPFHLPWQTDPPPKRYATPLFIAPALSFSTTTPPLPLYRLTRISLPKQAALQAPSPQPLHASSTGTTTTRHRPSPSPRRMLSPHHLRPSRPSRASASQTPTPRSHLRSRHAQ